MRQTITAAHKTAALIPHAQYAVTIEHRETFQKALERLELRLTKCPKIGETEGLKEHPAVFHYFHGGTDIYICEYDGDDEMFGYTILNVTIQPEYLKKQQNSVMYLEIQGSWLHWPSFPV
jgi:hypothetical protein